MRDGPGLCVSPVFLPSASDLDRLRPTFLRSLLYSLADLDTLMNTGLPLVITLNNECSSVLDDWSGWRETLREIGRQGAGQVVALAAGNEFDIYWADNPNDVPPSFAAGLARDAREILPETIDVYPVSVAGRLWQEYLGAMAPLLGGAASACDIHPYGQAPDGWPGWGFGSLRAAICRVSELSGGLPVVLTEYGVKTSDAGGDDQQAQFLADAARTIGDLGPLVQRWSWFAWSDALGTPEEQASGAGFGLTRSNGTTRPAYATFSRLGISVPVPAPPLPAPTPAPIPPEVIVPVTGGHTHDVGSGLLTWLAEAKTVPIACSTFLPLGRPVAEIECAYGADGAEYRWSLVESRRLARFSTAPTAAA